MLSSVVILFMHTFSWFLAPDLLLRTFPQNLHFFGFWGSHSLVWPLGTSSLWIYSFFSQAIFFLPLTIIRVFADPVVIMYLRTAFLCISSFWATPRFCMKCCSNSASGWIPTLPVWNSRFEKLQGQVARRPSPSRAFWKSCLHKSCNWNVEMFSLISWQA